MSSRHLDETNTTAASSRPQAANMDRETALQVLAEDVLSDRDYGEDRDLVSCLVKGLLKQDWKALQERLDEPLTEAQVTHVMKRALGVMSDLVLSLVPTMQTQELSQQWAQAQSRSANLSKSVRFASPLNCDVEFLETATEDVMCIITASYDLIHSLEQKESDAGIILQALTSSVSSFTNPPQTDQDPSVPVSESHFTYDPPVDCCTFFDRTFWLCTHKIKASLNRRKKGHSLTVCPQKVTTELVNEEFQRSCRDELKTFLLRNHSRLLHDSDAQVSPERVTAAASELLDTVMVSARQLCEPVTARKIKVSEENLHKNALDLKCNISSVLLRFFTQEELLTESNFSDEVTTSLEEPEILSKSNLTLFVTLLTDKVYTKYYPRDVSEQEELNPSFKARSFPEVNKPDEENTEVLPSQRTCAFVAEAVTFLLKSLSFPSPNSESVNDTSRATLLPDDAINCAISADPELEQLIARLQNLQPELF